MGKKALSLEEAKKVSTNSDSADDETYVTRFMVKSSRIKKRKRPKLKQLNIKSEVRKEEMVDLLGPEVVNMYYNDKLEYDRYCDKMLNRRAESRITNCDVLIERVQLHLKTGKGWTTINDKIRIRMDYIYTTKSELSINLDIPLSEQDPLEKLNDLANKKRKHADDIHDFFKANKRLKSSVRYEDHLVGIVLNEPVLGMIMFNYYHRQDFVTIKVLKEFPNTMLYTIQEIFFRRHQGPGLDDHARTFSSFLLAEVDKRNLNPLKQMRVIEQLKQ
nr:hypothetical protein [Tanacetum cinerariifolium]